jgi:LemA protein
MPAAIFSLLVRHRSALDPPGAPVSTAVIALAVVVVVAVIVGLWIVVTYNALVRRRNAVNNAWSQIDVQLKRRYDLIPNLIETVRGYATHERQTFDSITAARAAAISAQGPVEQAKAENVLTGALRSVFSVAEAYPQLQASRNFADLQAELSDSENRIAYSRQYYNDTVLGYNNAVQTMPAMFVAGPAGFTPREQFEAPTEERAVPQVRF